jgi:hypothetical protein
MLASHTCGQYWTATVREAAEWLNRSSANVVICDDRLPDGHWQDLWEHLRRQPDPPVFIVSAAWNDAHLWAEVLNLGGVRRTRQTVPEERSHSRSAARLPQVRTLRLKETSLGICDC